MPIEALLTHPKIIALYQALVKEANTNLAPWSTIKHFNLLISVDDDLMLCLFQMGVQVSQCCLNILFYGKGTFFQIALINRNLLDRKSVV